MDEMTKQYRLESRIGRLYLIASDKSLKGVTWRKQPGPVVDSLAGKDPATRILKRAVSELTEYLEGKRKRFAVPLDAKGTLFQKQVWAELMKIPYGQTCSYRDIAKRLKNSNAVRAVGSANGRNPLCIIVPCHRVIAASGQLGGYSGGMEIKTRLLELEKV